MKEQSGFGQDPETGLITASKESWIEVIRTRKSCRWHRYNVLKYTDILEDLYSTTIATGSRAITLQASYQPQNSNIDPALLNIPSTTSISRKRSRVSEKDIQSKRIKKEESGNSVLRMAIAIEGFTQVREGKLQVALDLLHEIYINQLSETHFDIAIDFLDSERKALTFVGLRGVVRDRWLERHANVQLINKAVEDFDEEE